MTNGDISLGSIRSENVVRDVCVCVLGLLIKSQPRANCHMVFSEISKRMLQFSFYFAPHHLVIFGERSIKTCL